MRQYRHKPHESDNEQQWQNSIYRYKYPFFDIPSFTLHTQINQFHFFKKPYLQVPTHVLFMFRLQCQDLLLNMQKETNVNKLLSD